MNEVIRDPNGERIRTEGASDVGNAAIAFATEEMVGSSPETRDSNHDKNVYLGRWVGDGEDVFVPGDANSYYIEIVPSSGIGYEIRKVPFTVALGAGHKDREAGTDKSIKNNGIRVTVDCAGRVYHDSFVSGYDAFADPGANGIIWEKKLMSLAVELGVQIDAPDDPIVEGAQQYEPDLPTLAEQIASDIIILTLHSNRLDRFKSVLNSEDAGTIQRVLEEVAKKEGVAFDKAKSHVEILSDIIEAQEKVVSEIKNGIEMVKIFDRIGYHNIDVSERDRQQMYDLGKYTVDELNGLIRFVDTRGRYMEAPLSKEAIETLKDKGYSKKYELLAMDGSTVTVSEVVKPRRNGQSERSNSGIVASLLAGSALNKMLPMQVPAFGVNIPPDSLAGGKVFGVGD